MAIVLTVTNQKGGVGKTTTATAIAAGLARRGARVLGIDLDPQGNLGFCLGLEGNGPTVLDALQGKIRVQTAIRRLPLVDVLASDITLSSSGLDKLPPGERESTLRKTLEPVMDYYDYVVIDTPPVGLSQLRETIDSVRMQLNPDLRVLGILLNRFTKRTRLAKDVLDMADTIAKQIGTKVFDTKIRNSIAVAEAPAHGEDVFTFDRHSTGARDYESLIDEIAKDIKLEEVLADGKV